MAQNTFGVYSKVSLAATARSVAVLVPARTAVSVAVRTTGTASGSWSVQYSPDYIEGTDDPTADTKWDTYTLSTTPTDASGAAQTFAIVLDDYEFRWVRVKFTSTGGSGTAEFWFQLMGA